MFALLGHAGFVFARQWESNQRLAADAVGMLVGVTLVASSGRRLWLHRESTSAGPYLSDRSGGELPGFSA
jgi:hypothetical protein